jgi:cysteine desulfurase / selenocysteine lyase
MPSSVRRSALTRLVLDHVESSGGAVIVDALVPRETFAALRRCVYLNQASLGLVPQASTEAMVRFTVDVAQHGNVLLSDAQEARILDELRAAATDFLDAPAGSVAVVGGASEALGQLAAILASRPGAVVLVRTDFPSVTYPWLGAQQRLGTSIRWVDDHPSVDLTAVLLEAIQTDVSTVCIGAVQYATGSGVNVPEIVRRAHQVGAKVVVDVTQLAGAAPVSMRDWGADAVVCSGYKWLSAHGGVALLAVDEELVHETPHLVGWKGAADPFDFHPDQLVLSPDARRFELSTMSYGAAVSLSASLAMLRDVGMPSIAAHTDALARELVSQVAPLGWAPFRSLDSSASTRHILSLRHPTRSAVEVQRLLEEAGIVVSSRGGGLRVSLHHYNDSSDVGALVGALAAVASA